MAPEGENLDDEFVSDCVVWSLFSASNQTVSMKDVMYKKKTYQIHNHLFPFPLAKVKSWKCALVEMQNNLAAAKDNRFVAEWLAAQELSPEAKAVLQKGELVYQKFYESLVSLPFPKYKISYWDAGLYQIRNALQEAGLAYTEIANMNEENKKLGAKLLPQLYDLGFLQGREHIFEEELNDEEAIP
jgi:hypothetical protein